VNTDGEGVEVMVVRWPDTVLTNVVGAKVLTKVTSVSPWVVATVRVTALLAVGDVEISRVVVLPPTTVTTVSGGGVVK
jgi:hypothetical protein